MDLMWLDSSLEILNNQIYQSGGGGIGRSRKFEKWRGIITVFVLYLTKLIRKYRGSRLTKLKHFFTFLGQVLLKEWCKYRYGIFPENGFFHDSLYPATYNEGNTTLASQGCLQQDVLCPLGKFSNNIEIVTIFDHQYFKFLS